MFKYEEISSEEVLVNNEDKEIIAPIEGILTYKDKDTPVKLEILLSPYGLGLEFYNLDGSDFEFENADDKRNIREEMIGKMMFRQDEMLHIYTFFATIYHQHFGFSPLSN